MKFGNWKFYLPYIFTVVALTVFVVYLGRNANRYRQLLHLSAGLLSLLLGLRLAFFLVNSFSNYLFYRGLRIPLAFNESVGLTAVNALANQLPLSGGLIARSVYLKQRYQVAYTRFLSATVALYVCYVAANGAVGVGILIYWVRAEGRAVPTLLMVGFLVLVASLSLFWLPLDAGFLPGNWRRRLAQLTDGWLVLSQNWTLAATLVGLQILMTVMFAGRLWIAFRALSQEVTLAQCILFSAATILTRLVSVAPGGLGVREALVAGVASVLGFDADVSVLAVALDRLLATSVTVALGTVYTFVLSKRITEDSGEP